MPPRLAGPSMLALIADMTGPSLWRVLQPITALQQAGYPCGWDRKDAAAIGTIALLFDGYLLPRMSWQPGERHVALAWFALLRRAGKVVIYDLDDDVLTSADTYRRIELDWTDGKSYAELEAERFERIWAMQQCDGVTVSTQRLATIVRSFTDRPVIVVPNAIDVPWFRGVLQATTRQIQAVTVGWAGGRRADDDVAPMAEAWARIAAPFPAVRFVVQGWVPPIIRASVPPERLALIPWLPLASYPAGLKEVDIACCSVADRPFNRAKSNIKALEAAVAGAAVVASPLLYASVIEHGRTGYLAETVDDWEAALARLVASHAERRMMARRLLRVVERNCSLAENLWRWPAAWQLIADDAARRRSSLISGTIGMRNVPA